MKKTYLLILITSTVISCKSIPDFDYSKLTKTDTIYKLDLSNRNLKEQPNLSGYTIIDLNLSNNEIKTFNEKFLPKELQKLNFSSNKLKGKIGLATKNNFESLDFSNNKIDSFGYMGIAQNVNLSKNKLKSINFLLYNDIRADTLNVADNKDLETKSWAFPKFYKTVINYSISTKN